MIETQDINIKDRNTHGKFVGSNMRTLQFRFQGKLNFSFCFVEKEKTIIRAEITTTECAAYTHCGSHFE
jgi:hypothetical protein